MDIKDMPFVTVEQVNRMRDAALTEIERLRSQLAAIDDALAMRRPWGKED